jgi:hypothetical protein
MGWLVVEEEEAARQDARARRRWAARFAQREAFVKISK